MPFEVREGVEEEHTPATDLTMCHQVLEEADKFESSFLILDRCCFLALLRVDTHLLWALWNGLRLPSVGFAFHEENANCFKATASQQDSECQEREDEQDDQGRDGMNLCLRESRFLLKNPQAEAELISVAEDIGDLS